MAYVIERDSRSGKRYVGVYRNATYFRSFRVSIHIPAFVSR